MPGVVAAAAAHKRNLVEIVPFAVAVAAAEEEEVAVSAQEQ